MTRLVLPFLIAFCVTALGGLVTSACSSPDCRCKSTPSRPEASAPLTQLEAISFDARGEPASIGVQPESASLEVTGDRVVIRYAQAGIDHEVVYRVVGPR